MLDLLTTLAFLSAGVQEANRLVNLALRSSSHPLQGLLVVKTFALMIGFYCWRAGRHRVLVRANWVFAALVAWNLISLLVASRQTS